MDTFVADVSEVGRMKFVEMDMKTSLAISVLSLRLINKLYFTLKSKDRINRIEQHEAMQYVDFNSCMNRDTEKYLRISEELREYSSIPCSDTYLRHSLFLKLID